MSSIGLAVRLFTSVVLIASAVLARDAPTAFVILLALGVLSLVFTLVRYRNQRSA